MTYKKWREKVLSKPGAKERIARLKAKINQVVLGAQKPPPKKRAGTSSTVKRATST